MSYFNNSKWTSWVIALLVLLNVGTLASMWLRPPPHHPKPSKLLKRALQLDDQQAARFETLHDQHIADTKNLHRDLLEKKREMIKLLTITPPDTTAARIITTEIGSMSQRLDNLLIDHYLSLNAICTPEQQKKLGELFLKSMDRGRRPRPPKRK